MSELIYKKSNVNLQDENTMLEIKEKIKMPNGTILIINDFSKLNDLFSNVDILKVASGGHIFIIRKRGRKLTFYKHSLSTGTLACEIELFREVGEVSLGINWGYKKIEMFILSNNSKRTLSGKMIESDIELIEINEKILEVKGNLKNSLYLYNKTGEVRLTAINSWNEILKGISLLKEEVLKEKSKEIIVVNLSILSLVSGFESYLKKRFLELEKEGIEINYDKIYSFILTKDEKENMNEIIEEAAEKNISELELLINEKGKINFQIYDNVKKVFSKAYNIKISDLEIDSKEIEYLKRIIQYRHKITHVSPMLPVLNADKLKVEETEYSTINLLEKAIEIYSNFINKVHSKTLELN
ncbi:hypothetical protein H3N56_04100 [Cetobacterium sp. 2A]|uniref:hypothetical protein n=1 Tax=Cetobacterium sp. 2A TaxID=2754723 RepID=UPI00163BB237|nr:hypothetical protein [Cetobacterium sp. 2A]MBC2855680.1 hypothetical protein [Cetobacterium sp. 2A]